MQFQSIAERDEFLLKVAHRIPAKLPNLMSNIVFTFEPGRNWVVFRYPDLHNCHYELHLAKRSKNHAQYFGNSTVDIIAVYYKGGPNTRAEWLKAMQVHVPSFNTKLAEPVVLGEWGKDWVWLALNLRKYENFGYDPDVFSSAIALFIQITFGPIHQVFLGT